MDRSLSAVGNWLALAIQRKLPSMLRIKPDQSWQIEPLAIDDATDVEHCAS
jgi:hypothetical protein